MKKLLVEKIRKQAELDSLKRKDPRFLRTMEFLVRKGFLKANRNYEKWNSGKLYLRDALWAGENVEPRVLEVLPAVAVRLPKEVNLNGAPKVFFDAFEALKKNQNDGPDFFGVSFDKYKVWLDLELKDKRTKPVSQKKIMKSFRLSFECIRRLEEKMQETGESGSNVIESLLKKAD